MMVSRLGSWEGNLETQPVGWLSWRLWPWFQPEEKVGKESGRRHQREKSLQASDSAADLMGALEMSWLVLRWPDLCVPCGSVLGCGHASSTEPQCMALRGGWIGVVDRCPSQKPTIPGLLSFLQWNDKLAFYNIVRSWRFGKITTFNLLSQDKEDILIKEKAVTFKRNASYGDDILKTRPPLYDLIVKNYPVVSHTELKPEFFHLSTIFQTKSPHGFFTYL